MFVFVARKIVAPWLKFWAWLPLVSLPGVAVGIGADWPAWAFMWLLAFSIYAGLKWLSFADSVDLSRSTLGRSLGYLLLWPGMDAKSFLATGQTVERPSLQEWFLAFGKVALGAMLIFAGASLVHQDPLAAGWTAMAGIAFTLHFGLFHVLSVGWRRAGVDAAPSWRLRSWPRPSATSGVGGGTLPFVTWPTLTSFGLSWAGWVKTSVPEKA